MVFDSLNRRTNDYFFQNNNIISTLVVTISPAILISIETKNIQINYLKAEIRKTQKLNTMMVDGGGTY